jgi:hypothetical protein
VGLEFQTTFATTIAWGYGSRRAPAQFRQSAAYLDRILRGEKPAGLPVQQPTRFQYAINVKTAQALDFPCRRRCRWLRTK